MLAKAPTGTVTLVFTDVQGSSTIWERAPGPMRAALAAHNQLLRAGLQATGGYEVKTEGDAFMAAFREPTDALRWCLDAQIALLEAEWPAELLSFADACEIEGDRQEILFRGLRVRMGAHLGRPDCQEDPTTGRMDYFGRMVNRAARVSGAAHGGQILVSGSLWRELSDRLPALGSPVHQDLGDHRLKGLEGVERLVQVMPRSLAERKFPPLKTLDPRRTNLPLHPASFVGRDDELSALTRALDAGYRLITLLGPGGMGKTRLASRFAATRLDAFEGSDGGGAWFSDLSAATTSADICAVVERSLQVAVSANLSLAAAIDQLGSAIHERGRILLVLDNFEQVAHLGPATVGRWLELAPRATFLVTSRERLRLHGETVIELSPLGLPPGSVSPSMQGPTGSTGRAALGSTETAVQGSTRPEPQGTTGSPAQAAIPAASDAERLFHERSRAVRPGYAQTERDLRVVRDIVRALDGIPLAIELAAARATILAPEQLLSRLERRLDLLTAGGRDAPSRQATLRAAIDWSWQLLEPWECSALAQCAVFKGGWDLEAAEAVLDLSGYPGSPPVLDVLQALKDKSMLRLHEDPGGAGSRFGMYVTIQDYDQERLAQSGDLAVALDRHAAYFLGRAQGMVPWFREGLEPRLQALAPDRDNYDAVLCRALGTRPVSPEAVNAALVAGIVLERFAALRGPIETRFTIDDQVIKLAQEASGNPPLLGWFHEARGRALITSGRVVEGKQAFEEAAAYGRGTGERLLEATALRGQALIARSEYRLDDAWCLATDGLAIMRDLGEKAGQGLMLGSLASFWQQLNRLDIATGMFDEALTLYRDVDSPRLEGECLNNVGLLNQELGHFDIAESYFRRALALISRTGDSAHEGYALGFLAGLEFERGRLDVARDLYLGAIRALRAIGEQFMQFVFLANLGGCLAQAGSLAEADVTLAAAERLMPVGDPVPPLLVSQFRGLYHVAQARRLSGEGEAEAAAEHLKMAQSRLQAAYEPFEGMPHWAQTGNRAIDRTEDVRFAARLLKKALDPVDSAGASGGN